VETQVYSRSAICGFWCRFSLFLTSRPAGKPLNELPRRFPARKTTPECRLGKSRAGPATMLLKESLLGTHDLIRWPGDFGYDNLRLQRCRRYIELSIRNASLTYP
jgi:hypothetical protein